MSTHHVRGAGTPLRGVRGGVGGGPVGVVIAITNTQFTFTPIPFVYHQVYGHLAFETGDVSVAEVVA